ncbi:MAG: class I SAM-dependent methyltransferase [Bacteroidota bacterium]|jgi:2-polyprenyl-3-methyl-5-hydroxy-6-metoxy-1,4-benzoquinol methylase
MNERGNKKTDIEVCPLCGSSQASLFLNLQDYSITGEDFAIYTCGNCSFKFTADAPSEENIAPYYKAEEYISHTETKKGLISNLYHRVRKITLQQKAKMVSKYTGKIVGHHLDIGAGTGAFVHAMENAGWNSIGIEPEASARKRANELYLASVYPMSELNNFSEKSYTAVTLWHVLEHVHQLHDLLTKIKNILDTDGRVFIAVPNHESFDARYYGKYWAAYDVPRHLYHFTPVTMKKLLEQHGLDIVQIKPMWFDSFYVSMLSEKYKKGNIIRGLLIAAISNLQAIFMRNKCSSLIYIAALKRKSI